MSAATFTDPTPSTPEAPSHIPVALWKAYRWQRSRNERPRIAASIALDQLRYTSQRSREPLTAMLTERERERGLGSTEAEQDEERALESAELEAGGAVVPMEPEQGSAEAVRRDAQRTIAALEVKRAGLAPEALTDLDVRGEVEKLDGEIQRARATAELADAAESETARRVREQVEQSEREAREHASTEAAKLEPVIAKARADVDAKAIAWATSVAALRDWTEQRVTYVAGAEPNDAMAIRSARFRPEDVVSGLKAAMRDRVDLGAELGASRRDALLAAEPEGE